MAADLVTAAQLATHLGISDPGGGIFDALLEAVEADFERAVGRTATPFRSSGSLTEVFDGTGTTDLYLGYPVSSLTSIKLGEDTSNPDETLDFTDLDVLRYAAGSRRLVRVDGGVFRCRGEPRVIHVAYTCAADLPADAAYAVKVVAGIRYNKKGAETLTSERLGSWSAEYSDTLSTGGGMPYEWTSAIANHMAAVV